MNNKLFSILLGGICSIVLGQNMTQKLEKATQELLQSPEMISANFSFYVTDEKGNLVFDYQGNKGLSTASTQKIFTAITALDLLGSDYQYTTQLFHSGNIENSVLKGDLILSSDGDPTLGSWRYETTQPEKIREKIINAIKSKKIKKIEGNIIIDDSIYDFQTIPGGWAWNDIGNYYGAGVFGVNWRENQFDIHLLGGKKESEPTQILKFSNPLHNVKWRNETQSYQGTRDQSIIYTAPFSEVAVINGKLPMDKVTKVSGATPNPPLELGQELAQWFKQENIDFQGNIITASNELLSKGEFQVPNGEVMMTHYSPKMSEIVHHFLQKSVNLYGESMIKTISKKQNNDASFSNGIQILKNFWQEKKIHPAMINFIDGSGLSPQNYASTRAEVQALLWAKKQKWFPIFEEALPIYNKMKMKSGTIKDTKAYAGYHNGYIFAVIVNNYHGKNVNEKLFRLLDILKQ